MFEKDYIIRQIENLTHFLVQLIFQRESRPIDLIDEQGNFSQTGLLHNRLQVLIRNSGINEAENLLFKEFKKDPSRDMLDVAIRFYQDLQKLGDSALLAANFSRQEILEGLQEIRLIYEQAQ